MKFLGELIGGLIGLILGLYIPMAYAQFEATDGRPPNAANAVFWFITVPIGITFGAACGRSLVSSLQRKE